MKALKTVLIFFVGGLSTGCLFGSLTSFPRLTNFWYRKGDKFLIPTYRYYLGLGLFLLLGLSLAYTISLAKAWLNDPSPGAFLKQGCAALIIAISALVSYLLTFGNRSFDPVTLYLLSILVFLMLISIACWIVSSRLYYVGLLLNVLVFPVALAFLYVLTKIGLRGEAGNFVTFPVFFSLLSASCGYWLSQVTGSSSS